MRSVFFGLSLFGFTFVPGCGSVMVGSDDSGNADVEYTWGDAATGNSGDADTDTDSDSDSDTDSDADTDSGWGTDSGDTSTDSSEIVTVDIWPNAIWDVSCTTCTGYPVASMYKPANVTLNQTFDGSIVDTDSTGSYLSATSTITPGDTLEYEIGWNDGVRARYLAEVHNVLNLKASTVQVTYEDGSQDWFPTDSTGTTTTEGHAYWHANSDNTGGVLYVHFYSDN